MKLTVSCQECGRTISTIEKNKISQDDISIYATSSVCEVDGPFLEYDGDGNPLPMDYSNILATKTLL